MSDVIGVRLKQLRIEAGLSMDDEAEKLNKAFNLKITKSMMSRWENGSTQPTNIFLSAYAQYHDVDLNYLVGLTDLKKSLRECCAKEEFSSDERSIINKYRALDERGKFNVRETVDREYSFISKDKLPEAK